MSCAFVRFKYEAHRKRKTDHADEGVTVDQAADHGHLLSQVVLPDLADPVRTTRRGSWHCDTETIGLYLAMLLLDCSTRKAHLCLVARESSTSRAYSRAEATTCAVGEGAAEDAILWLARRCREGGRVERLGRELLVLVMGVGGVDVVGLRELVEGVREVWPIMASNPRWHLVLLALGARD